MTARIIPLRKDEPTLWRLYQLAHESWCANPCPETERERQRAFREWNRVFLESVA